MLSIAQAQQCVTHETCGKCLSADLSCSWCTDPNYDMRKPRCLTIPNLIAANCTKYFENKPPIMNLVENKENHDFGVGSLDAIQIQPQRAKLTLRKSL